MRQKSLVLLIVLIVLTLVSSCRTAPGKTGGVPPLRLEHGWSPPSKMMLNGGQAEVQCMTVQDAAKLREYLIIIEEQQGITPTPKGK